MMLHIVANRVERFERLVVQGYPKILGALADLLEIDRRMSDLRHFYAALAIRHGIELCSDDVLGIGIRRCTDKRFLRKQQHTGVEIADRRNIAIMVLLTKIFDPHADRRNRVLK